MRMHQMSKRELSLSDEPQVSIQQDTYSKLSPELVQLLNVDLGERQPPNEGH